MLTAIVIDDELNGRIALKQKLHDYCPSVEVVGEAEMEEKALKRSASLSLNLFSSISKCRK